MGKRIGKTIGWIVVALVAAFGVLLLILTLTEYRPADTEDVPVSGNASRAAAPGDSLTILSWNIGYCGLGNTADFFMDGGTSVRENTRAQVEDNLQAVQDFIESENPDVVYLQETDKDSSRTYHIDEVAAFSRFAQEQGMESLYAANYNCLFIPYPVPPLGTMHAGLMTLTGLACSSASRIQLPCPFKWPVRLANLKRCLLVTRISLEDSDRELVLVNLHLEAYDSGKGKIAQTKMLADFIQNEYDKGNFVIAGGDFNQSFSSTDTSMYPRISGDLWQAGELDTDAFSQNWQFLMDTSVPTCRSLDRAYLGAEGDFQFYMIDGFIVSDNVRVDSMQTVDLNFEHSDHNPIRMKVTLLSD